MIRRGEVWWAELAEPTGSGPGFRRPVLVVQADTFNRSAISTVIVAVVTSNLRLGAAPGNVPLTRRQSGLAQDSIINVSQLLTIDRAVLRERIGRLPGAKLTAVDEGIALVLGLHPVRD